MKTQGWTLHFSGWHTWSYNIFKNTFLNWVGWKNEHSTFGPPCIQLLCLERNREQSVSLSFCGPCLLPHSLLGESLRNKSLYPNHAPHWKDVSRLQLPRHHEWTPFLFPQWEWCLIWEWAAAESKHGQWWGACHWQAGLPWVVLAVTGPLSQGEVCHHHKVSRGEVLAACSPTFWFTVPSDNVVLLPQPQPGNLDGVTCWKQDI